MENNLLDLVASRPSLIKEVAKDLRVLSYLGFIPVVSVLTISIPLFLKKIDYSNLALISASFILVYALGVAATCYRISKRRNKRRHLFSKSFDPNHLLTAERCEVESIKNISFYTAGRKKSKFGKVFKVKGRRIWVIYNNPMTKSSFGYLLKYENEYFFIPEKLKLKPSQRMKAA